MDELITYLQNISDIFQIGVNNPDTLHPLLVHIPIGVLFIAPLFFILAMCLKELRRPFFWSCAILTVIGTFTLWLSLITGEMSSEYLPDLPDLALAALGHHDELAHLTRNIFILLSTSMIIYILGYKSFFFNISRRWHNLFYTAFLLTYLFGLFFLANTAHYGGKLVHQYSVTTTIFNDE